MTNKKNKIIIALASHIGAGKGVVGDYIIKKYKADRKKFSDCLGDIADRCYLEKNRTNLQGISTALRGFYGEDFLSNILLQDISKSKSKIVIIDGVRRKGDINKFINLPNFYLIFIDANLKLRYQRLLQRLEKPDEKNKSFKEFKIDNNNEAGKQIDALKPLSNFVIKNNKDLAYLYNQVDNILNKVKKG